MPYAPYTNLQATTDFASFQFDSPTLPEATTRQVRFIGQQNGRIYHVDLRNKPTGKHDDPSWPDSKDFLCTVVTVIQIIEVYLERYPRRIVRFSGDSPLKAMVFGVILSRFHHLLSPLFQIDTETPGPMNRDDERSYAFLIKRKPVPFFSVHTVESTWSGTSRIFNTGFSVGIDKSIRVGLTLPTI
jgi:hypothetical protein